MKVAIIGSGGREHSICYKLKQSKNLKKLVCIPGNAGTAQICENLNGNSLNNCLNKNQIETLLAKKNEVTNINHKVYLSNESSKLFETNIFYVMFLGCRQKISFIEMQLVFWLSV